MKTNFNELAKEVYTRNCEKGFWDEGVENKNIGEVLMLITSELSEALEADRKNHHVVGNMLKSVRTLDSEIDREYFKKEFERTVKNSFEDELADVIIRVMDLCGAKGIDIDWHIEQKMKYNLLRPHKHGKKY